MPRAVIITSYLEYPLNIPPLLERGDYIVCLDGGYDIAKDQGIRPDLLLGDFDSIRLDPEEDASVSCGQSRPEIRRWPPEKDYTDLELAYRELDPEQYPDLLVIGGLGGRLDHTLANVQMLAAYTGPGNYKSIRMMDGRNRCFVIRGYEDAGDEPAFRTIQRIEHTYLALIPLFNDCEGLTIRGVKYPLEDAKMARGASLGISNEFCEDTARIRLRRGTLLVVLSGKEK